MGVAGLNLVTESFHDVFVHKSMFREKYRLGQLVEVRITHFSENGYSGSLMPQKEVLRLDDAEIILTAYGISARIAKKMVHFL